MVRLGTVGFALSVVVVLEFDSACWAVCDAHGLCSCEYLFSELFVFPGACSAHRVSLFCVCVVLLCGCCCVVLGGGASQRQRDERLHRLTLLSSSFLLVFFCLWNGGCCVVRAQPCEHARNTTPAFVFLGLFTVCGVCCFYHNVVFVVLTTHCSLLTIAMFIIEH